MRIRLVALANRVQHEARLRIGLQISGIWVEQSLIGRLGLESRRKAAAP